MSARLRGPQFMTHSCLNFLNLGTASGEQAIAVRRDEGAGPGLFWLGGFKSDMKGTKARSEEHTSELQSLAYLVCRLLLDKKNKKTNDIVVECHTRSDEKITFQMVQNLQNPALHQSSRDHFGDTALYYIHTLTHTTLRYDA